MSERDTAYGEPGEPVPPTDFHEWAERTFPEWFTPERIGRGLAYNDAYMAACGAWDAAIDAARYVVATTPVRELRERLLSLHTPPPIG